MGTDPQQHHGVAPLDPGPLGQVGTHLHRRAPLAAQPRVLSEAEGVVRPRPRPGGPRPASGRSGGCRSGPAGRRPRPRGCGRAGRTSPTRRYPTSPVTRRSGRLEMPVAAVPPAAPHVERAPGTGVHQQVDVAGQLGPDPGRERDDRCRSRGVRREPRPSGSGSRTIGRPRTGSPMVGTGTGAEAGAPEPSAVPGRHREAPAPTRRARVPRTCRRGRRSAWRQPGRRGPCAGATTPGRARSGCRRRPSGGRRPRWCPVTRAAGPRR